MADDLEKFTLQYKIDADEAVKRLQSINKQVESVGKGAQNATKEMTSFAADAGSELGKLVPQLNDVAAAVRLIGTGFGAAGVAALAFAAASKTAMFARDTFNAQRIDARASGIGGLRLYDMQRKLTKGGNVSNEQVSDFFQRTQGTLNDYKASGGTNATARILGLMGVRPTMSTTNLDFNAMMANSLSKMDEAKALAFGKQLGYNPDIIHNMRALGPNFKNSSLKPEDVDMYNKGSDATADLNSKLADFNREMTKLGLTLGGEFLPHFTSFVEGITKTVARSEAQQNQQHEFELRDSRFTELQKARGFSSVFHTGEDHAAAELWAQQKVAAEKKLQADTSNTSKQTANTDKALEASDAQSAAFQDFAARLQLAVAGFQDGVNAMTGIVDEKHAWAIWAGEAGRAAFGGGKAATMFNGTGSAAFDPARQAANIAGVSKYDDIIKAASAKSGIPEEILRGVISVESRGVPTAVSEKGAVGLMQIMPSNFKALGITDATDPRQNIFGGAALLADYRKRAGGDWDTTLKMYHGGLDRSGWGQRTNAYPGMVMGAASMSGPRATAWDPTARSPITFSNPHSVNMAEGGASFAKTRLRSVYARLSQDSGMPMDQVMQGGYRSSDAGVYLGNDYIDLARQRQATQAAMAAPGNDPGMQNKLAKQLADVDIQLQNITEYGAQVVQGGQVGDRTISQGVEIKNTFNFSGGGNFDPHQLATEISNELAIQLHATANSNSTMVKR